MLWIGLGVALIIILVVRAYSVFVWQVPRYKAYWEQQNTIDMGENQRRYFALGDSAAQGIGASKPEKGYVGLVAEELRKQGRPVKVFNLSVSGAKARDVLVKQLPELYEYKITEDDVVTLAIGGNDMRKFDSRDFTDVINELVAKLPPQTIMADVPYFGGGRQKDSESQAYKASQIIAETVTVQNLRLAQLHQSTLENDSWRNYAADFFHPSDRGYKWWAEAFIRELPKD